jgi:hypothetical protein
MGGQKHTKLPWMAATAYSSMWGVPIVNQEGRRIANTALPDMPKEWDELKRQAVIDAAFICTAVNTYPAVEKLIRTLEFYADPDAWKKKNDPENLVAIPDFYFELDFGMEAKEALNRFRSLEAGKGGVG